MLRSYTEEYENIPPEWNVAFRSLTHTNSILVHSTNKKPITLMPTSSKTLSGVVRNGNSSAITVVTEGVDSQFPDSVMVCPRVVELNKEGKCRIPVRVCNMTAKVIKVKPKSILCSASEVKVLTPILSTQITRPSQNAALIYLNETLESI